MASVVVLVLLGGNAAFASSSQTLQFQSAGGPAPLPPVGVADSGDQKYNVHGTGLAYAQVGTLAFGPGTKFEYTLTAEVKELAAKGSASFTIQGTTSDNKKVTVKGEVDIGSGPTLPGTLPGMVPEGIPVGCSGSACTSAIPVFFVGALTLTTTIADSKPVKTTGTMFLESPYFNPWGGLISLAATDGSVVIATTYDKGTIEWTGTSVNGAIGGLLGASTLVYGTFSLLSHESENLVAGTASDDGTMTFSNMSPISLNVAGKYSGTSLIPKAGSPECALETSAFPGNPCTVDCVAMFAAFFLPALPGTCLSTGFQSSGHFSLKSGNDQQAGGNDQGDNNGHVTVDGKYSTTWAQPALGFVSSGSATVSTK